MDYHGDCEEEIHQEDNLDVGAEGIVLPRGAEVAVEGSEDEGEVDTAEKHEYCHDGKHVVAVPCHKGVIVGGEAAGAHGGECVAE